MARFAVLIVTLVALMGSSQSGLIQSSLPVNLSALARTLDGLALSRPARQAAPGLGMLYTEDVNDKSHQEYNAQILQNSLALAHNVAGKFSLMLGMEPNAIEKLLLQEADAPNVIDIMGAVSKKFNLPTTQTIAINLLRALQFAVDSGLLQTGSTGNSVPNNSVFKPAPMKRADFPSAPFEGLYNA